MPGGLAAYGEARVLEWLLSSVAVSRPAAWWMALHSSAPGEGGTIGELTAAGYARKAISWQTPANGVTANVGQIVFGPAGVDWPSVTHFSIWTLVNGGNCLLWGQLKSSKLVKSGNPLTFEIGTIKVALS